MKTIHRLISIFIVLILISTGIGIAAPFAYITNYVDSTMSVIDISTNLVTTTFPLGNGPFGVAVSPLGRVYVTNMNDNTISVIDTATYIVNTISIDNTPTGVAVSPDGSRVYVGYNKMNNASLAVIDASTNNITAKIDVGNNPWGIVVNPSGDRVYVVNRYYDLSISYGTVVVVNTNNNSVITNVPVGNDPLGIAINPSGTKIYTVGDAGYVSIIDASSNTVIGTIPVAGVMPWGIAVNPAGTRLYVVSRWHYSDGNGNVAVINTTSNDLVANVEVGFGATGISASPDNSKIYVANYESGHIGSVSVIDASSNTVSNTITVGRGPVAFGQFILPPSVIIYNFTGFFQPIDNLPTWNSIKAGSAVPVKFSLNGNQGLDIFVVGYPVSQNIGCDSNKHIDPIEETADSSNLSYNATTDQYRYIWKTDKAWKNSCRQLIMLLKDDTYHNASFNLN